MRIAKSTVISLLGLAFVIIGLPLGLLSYQAKRTGQSLGEYLSRAINRIPAQKKTNHAEPHTLGPLPEMKARKFLEMQPIGDPIGSTQPWISNLCIADLDKDGLRDVVICDAKLNQIRWIRQNPKGVFIESQVGAEVTAPAHVSAFDIDKDGDLDLLVAKMGMIFPNNDKIGSVVVLENDGKQQFTNRVLLDHVARVTDVESGDFDNDGLLDLAVGQFGYDDGEIRWMHNKGNWQFDSEVLLNLSGTIHVPVADMDGDGDLDIVALVSQEWEEVYVFENDGKGHFKTHMIWGSTNEDFGSSGISLVDLDKDGDLDIVYTNGDAFDYLPPGPRPWHGVQWIENKGGLIFEYHRIGDFPGAYFAKGVDVDKDGDLDIVAVSCFNKWDDPNAQSMMWYENDGKMNFTPHGLASSPTHLLFIDSSDMDDDGWTDFVTGGMYTYPPFDRMSRVTLWKNIWPKLQQTPTK